MLMDFHMNLYNMVSFEWDDWNEGWQPYADFKTAHFDKYLGSMLTDFHETSKTGILLMTWSKWGQQPYANFKTAHFVKYLRSIVDGFSHDLL